MKRFIPPVSRIFLALIFLISAIGMIADFSGTQQYMASYSMPLTALLLVLAIILELGGGLLLVLGFKTRAGALALIVFLVPATLIFHSALSEQLQMIMFLKNLSMLGGLLLILYFGPGPFSLDGESH